MYNIAPLGKAYQSSVSEQWSHHKDEAENVLSGRALNGYAFHTKSEINPWLLIDLQKNYQVNEITIHNRKNFEDRCKSLSVYISRDGLTWKEIYNKKEIFGGKYNSQPCRIKLDDEFLRFVRIMKNGFGVLHLSQIEIFKSDGPYILSNDVIVKNDKEIITPNIEKFLIENKYEASELSISLENIDTTDNILELGAGIGFISSSILSHISIRGYTAVEANPKLVEFIKLTHQLNSIRNCKVINAVACLFPESEELPFYLHHDFWASSFEKKPGTTEIMVRAVCFEKLLKEIKPSFIICDIEGGEHTILRKVALPSVKKICLELHGDQEEMKKTVEALSQQGFKTRNKIISPLCVAFFEKE